MTKNKSEKDTYFSGMDAGIKLIVTLFFVVVPFFCVKPLSFAVLFLILLHISAISGIKAKSLLKSVAAYLIVIILPLFFGIAVQALVTLASLHTAVESERFAALALQTARLFLLWYVTGLYIFTTPMEPFLGLMSKILTPLQKIGIPVENFLQTIRFVMMILGDMAKRFTASFKNVFTGKREQGRRTLRQIVKELTNVLVTMITDSLADTDKIQEMIEQDRDKGFSYHLKCTKMDIASLVLSCILLAVLGLIESWW
jgi:energy-coupling factor transporter transmembrane protein EcfT